MEAACQKCRCSMESVLKGRGQSSIVLLQKALQNATLTIPTLIDILFSNASCRSLVIITQKTYMIESYSLSLGVPLYTKHN